MFVNEIKINFGLSVKVQVKMHFLQDPLKAYIFHPNRFLYVLPKKPRTNFYWQLMVIILCLKRVSLR